PLPFRPLVVERLVNAHAAALAGLVAKVVAHTDDQVVAAVAVQVGTPDRVAPFELVVDHVPVPLPLRIGGRGVHHDLVAVPGFDGRDERLAVFQLTLLDFTAAAAAVGIGLVAGTDQAVRPLVAVALQQAHALV